MFRLKTLYNYFLLLTALGILAVFTTNTAENKMKNNH